MKVWDDVTHTFRPIRLFISLLPGQHGLSPRFVGSVYELNPKELSHTM